MAVHMQVRQVCVVLACVALGVAHAGPSGDTLGGATLVSVPDGCAEGEFWSDPWREALSASFSCGLRVVLTSVGSVIPEQGDGYGILLVHRDSCDSMGYSGGTRVDSLPGLHYTYTIDNPDTVWDNALSLPDSLFGLDTFDTQILLAIPSLYPSYGARGRCFAVRHVPTYPPGTPVWCSEVPDHNTIIYARCNSGRCVKLQVDTTVVPQPNGNCGLVHVRWAADSAGNGLFRAVPTGARHPALCRTTQAAATAKSRMYDIRGRALPTQGADASGAPGRGAGFVVVPGGLVWRR